MTDGPGEPIAPDLSVVIATYNRADLLVRALDHLDRQQGCNVEVIVVDDGSSDATSEVLSERARSGPDRFRVVSRPENGGPASARNIGWPLARAAWVAFTDDDCEPAPQWAAALLRAGLSTGADIVQGRTDPNPEHVTTGCWDRSARIDRFSDRYQTCNLLVRRSVLVAVGGFDDSFPFAGEDADLGWRARKAGFTAVFAEDALVFHAIRPCSFAQHLRDRAIWADLCRFFKRHPEARGLLFARLFYRRSHLVFLGGAPVLFVAGASVGWWLPPSAVAMYIGYRTHRIAPSGMGLRARLVCASQGVVATAWEIVQFVRSSARHRTWVL